LLHLPPWQQSTAKGALEGLSTVSRYLRIRSNERTHSDLVGCSKTTIARMIFTKRVVWVDREKTKAALPGVFRSGEGRGTLPVRD
jgi:hypothetical protein